MPAQQVRICDSEQIWLAHSEYLARALSQRDEFSTFALATCGKDDLIAIFQPPAPLPVGQHDGLSAIACKFQQTRSLLALGAGDCPRSQHIAGLQIATV